MSHASDEREPQVIWFDGEQVYAPFCWWCYSDRYTEWKDLPPLAKLQTSNCVWDYIRGYCRHCGRIIDSDRAEALKAREPEKLAARLAELQAEAKRSA